MQLQIQHDFKSCFEEIVHICLEHDLISDIYKKDFQLSVPIHAKHALKCTTVEISP